MNLRKILDSTEDLMDTDPDMDTDLVDMEEVSEVTEGAEPESDDIEEADFNADLLEDGSDGVAENDNTDMLDGPEGRFGLREHSSDL